MRFIPLALVFALITPALGCATDPTPTATPTPSPAARADGFGVADDGQTLTFPDTVTLANPAVRIGVSPTAGRAVVFGYTDGPNLLWTGPPTELANWRQPAKPNQRPPYANLGGDKVWLLPQGLWPRAFGGQKPWPPDGIIDGQPWTLIRNSNAQNLTIQSPICPGTGVQLTRSFTLHPTLPQVTTTTTATKLQPSSLPINIWTVTQIVRPDYTLLHRGPDTPAPLPSTGWIDLGSRNNAGPRIVYPQPNAIQFTYPYPATEADPTPPAAKIGTLGQWIAGVYTHAENETPLYFLQTIQYQPDAMLLDASNLQVYHENRYTELETLSPGVYLQPGESFTHTVVWSLTDQLPSATPATAPATQPAN